MAIMVNIVKRNWKEIQRLMLISVEKGMTWKEYSSKYFTGLSNNYLTKRGCGDGIWFVQHLAEYARLDDIYLKYAKKMSEDEIRFINDNRAFLLTVN